MEDSKEKILAFLIWFTKGELNDHMQFALGFYIVFCICMFPVPLETFGAHSPGLFIILGLQLALGTAYVIWYNILKKTMEEKITNAYLYAGTVFGSTSLVLFGSAAQVFYASGIPFETAHILANAAGIALNLFVLIIRIIQYKSKEHHTFGPIYGAGFIMPLVILGGMFFDRVEKNVSKTFMASVILMLGGYLMLCFALVFFINLYVARKHKMDKYYIATNKPGQKNKKQ